VQHKVPDKLTDPTSVTCIHSITKHIGMLATGMHGGAQGASSGGPGHSMRRRGSSRRLCPPACGTTACSRPAPHAPAGDARSLVQKARAEAAEFRFK
jgi:hypothetical protein